MARNNHLSWCNAAIECICEIHRYWLCFAVVFFIFVMETAGGTLTHSLALLADAGHVLMDAIAILITIGIAYALRRHAKGVLIRRLGGLLNSALLGGTAVAILYEAIGRIAEPEPVKGLGMMLVALIGACGNFAQHQILEGAHDHHKHINHRILNAHVLSDLALSILVVIGGILIRITGEPAIDAILSMAASVLLGFWALKLARDSWRHTTHDDCHH